MLLRQLTVRGSLHNWLQRHGRSSTSPFSACLTGCIAGAALLAVCLQYLGLLGVSSIATSALAAALVAGLAIGVLCPWRLLLCGTPQRLWTVCLQAGLTIALIASPLLLSLADRLLTSRSLLHATSDLWNIGVLFCVALPTAGLVAFLAAGLVIVREACAALTASPLPLGARRSPQGDVAAYALGISAGLLLETMLFGPLFGTFWSVMFLAAAGLVQAILASRRSARAVTTDAEAAVEVPVIAVHGPQAAAASAAAATFQPGVWVVAESAAAKRPATSISDGRQALATRSQPANESATGFIPAFARTTLGLGVDVLLALTLGMLLPCLMRFADQLAPASVAMRSLAWGTFCLGLAGGLFWTFARGASPRRWSVAWLIAVWICALPALFPTFVHASLWLNAYVDRPWLLQLARGGIAGLALAPVGLAWAVSVICGASVSNHRISQQSPHFALRGVVHLLCGAIGCQAGSRWLIPSFGPAHAMLMLAIGLAVIAAVAEARAVLNSGRLVRLLTAGGAVLLAVLPLFASHYDPCHSARMLFGTNVFLAYRNGFDYHLLPYIDDGRNVAVVEGSLGTLTAWKHAGQQLRLRENGIPSGISSSDTELFPQFTAEVLQVVYPLVLHEKPNNLLLLGLGSGQPLSTALAFPLPEIVCAEPDGQLVNLVRTAASPAGTNPIDDERVQVVPLDAPLTLAALKETFDVIVSQPGQVALRQAQSSLTREFYARVARRLSADGVFCQRIQFIDLGPNPLRIMARTMQSVFREVGAIEVAPGEFLFVATNDERGLVRPELMDRVTAPHVRNVLGWTGLDWSVALNLPLFRNYELTRFAAETFPGANSSTNGRLAFSLPLEVARWGSKMTEIQASLAVRAERLLDAIGADAEAPELVRRLSEVQGQHQLMTKYSDQWWAYRASLRDQLTKQQKRSSIRQASHTAQPAKGPPLEDRRRLAYFTSLGQAVKTCEARDIEQLEQFEFPYDPLISYFVHQEAAELYSRSPEGDARRELRHRLHTIYYASPEDPSVICVLDAIRLICEHPEAVPAPLERWDTTNSLLQTLQMRWQTRTGVTPQKPDVVLGEIDESLLASEQALDMLTELATEAGQPAPACAARRRTLEITLLRPLRLYRTEILPHHLRAKKKLASKRAEPAEDSDAAPEASATDTAATAPVAAETTEANEAVETQ